MEAAPAASFVMAEAEFLLQLLVVALDAPAQLGEIDQTLKADVLGQRGEPVLGRLGFSFGPLDQQPFLGARLVSCSRDAPAARARAAKRERASAVPSRQVIVCQARCRQAEGERLDRDRLVLASRRDGGGRPRPYQGFGGNGPCPGGQTVASDWMPAT